MEPELPEHEIDLQIKALNESLVKTLTSFTGRKYGLWLCWLEDLPCSILARYLTLWYKANDDVELQGAALFLLFGCHLEPWISRASREICWLCVSSMDFPDQRMYPAISVKANNDHGADSAGTWSFYGENDRNKSQVAECRGSIESLRAFVYFSHLGIDEKSLEWKQQHLLWLRRGEAVLTRIAEAPGIVTFEDMMGPPVPKALIEEVCADLKYFTLDHLKSLCATVGLKWEDYPWPADQFPELERTRQEFKERNTVKYSRVTEPKVPQTQDLQALVLAVLKRFWRFQFWHRNRR